MERRLDLIYFDAGGTIIHPEPSPGAIYARVAGEHGLAAEPEAMDLAFRNAFALYQASEPDGRVAGSAKLWWRGVVAEAIRGFGRVRDFDAYFERLYHIFAEPDVWRVFPETLSVLARLHGAGYRTGLLSNWDDRLPGLLDRLGLTPHFDPIVISYAAGHEKPNPGIFRKAVEAAGAPASRILHVGDSPRDDWEGARQAGLASLLLDREGRFDGQAGVIRTLDGIFDHL